MTTPESEPARKHFETSVARLMMAESMWPEDGGMLVGVSGGPDSTALLLALHRLARRREIDLTVTHFDHGLRAAGAPQDEAAVRRLAKTLSLPVVVGRGKVRELAKAQHLSLEDAARRERYAFFAATARRTGCSFIAVGHTASDQAETVLLHAVRGAGLDGLSAMQARSSWPLPGGEGLTLVRPLLRISRPDVAAYCEASGIEPVQDETNESSLFRRNRLRNEVMPVLRQLNPRIDEALMRLADAAREDLEYLQTMAAPALGASSDGRQMLSRETLAGFPAALRREALRMGFERLLGDAQGLSQRHIAAMERLALKGLTGDSLDLPRGVHAEMRREGLLLRAGADEGLLLPDTPVTLTVPGAASFGPYLVAALPGQPHAQAISVRVDAEALGGSLRVRRRRVGDRIQPSGMQGQKKLQDLLVDAHIPRSQRDSLLLFETERGIAWVGGLRVAEWAKAIEGRPAVVLSYRVEA